MKLEPTATLAALAMVTEHIGLVATATTTYNEPYNIARRFMSIDHISGGRAGWNLVTSQIEDESENFGFDQHMAHAERYERAAEFYEVVTGLWDSWEDEAACCATRQSGLYMDRDKVHFLDHVGKYFKVKGPLNITRSVQGWPVIAQAGSSEAGRDLAARTADVVFTAQTKIDEAKAFYADIKQRAAKYGRAPEDIKIMPGLTPVLGSTMDEAKANYEELQSLMPDDVALLSLTHISGGLDLTKFPLDGPLPELPPSNAAKARQALVVQTARDNNMTLRQIARHTAAGTGHRVIVGTAGIHGRRDGEMAEGRGGRRLQRRLQPLSQAVRGFLHAGRARAAAARHLPHRVRRRDAARESRAQETGEPLPTGGPAQGGFMKRRALVPRQDSRQSPDTSPEGRSRRTPRRRSARSTSTPGRRRRCRRPTRPRS